jgi:UDP-2,4-diacetamido-2,4,6-trideoxy-beta-L-altropyranose hydrolase
MSNEKIIKIFTEGGEKIGFGHISRCTALYDEAIRQNIPVKLFIQNNGSDLSGILNGRNFSLVNWQALEFLENEIDRHDFCIIDSYCALQKIYEEIAKLCKKSLYIDDFGRLDYPEGIIVNPSISAEEIEYKNDFCHEYLLGAEYIILRTPFLNKKKKQIYEKVKTVLITFGGSDPLNITFKITESLSKSYPEIKFIVVFGAYSQDVEKMKAFSNVEPFFSITAEEMCDLMLKSDFAISAAGQTIFELLILGIPFIAIKTAENQNNNMKALNKLLENIFTIDGNEKNFGSVLIHAFEKIKIKENRDCFLISAASMIDGLGVKRIINSLIK